MGLLFHEGWFIMVKEQSLGHRAVLALGLFIGFYIIALLIIGILMAIPIAEYKAHGRVIIRLAVFCYFGAILIFWSIIPRPDRFVVPGPELTKDRYPELFRVISMAASAISQPMPKHVYLLPDVNAYVSYRGGIMGIRSNQIIGIGLPLLGILTVAQLQSVILHEFGHFVGGDLKLGPWIYKTRAAIGRTIVTLGKHSGMLQRPFVWYGNYFLKITLGISRQQEYFADRGVAKIIGKQACIDALTRIVSVSPIYYQYWSQEISPALSKGYVLPIMEGFDHLISTPKIQELLANLSNEAVVDEESDHDSTHPSLKNRIEALNLLENKEDCDNRPARSLVGDFEKPQEEVLVWLSSNMGTQLKPLQWKDSGTKVWLQYWEETDMTGIIMPNKFYIKELPTLLSNGNISSNITKSELDEMSEEDFHRKNIFEALSSLSAIALCKDNWIIRAFPGEETVFTKDNCTLTPFSLLSELIDKKIKAEQWVDLCNLNGIGDLELLEPTRSKG
jgi:heat shock protein HtpX